MARGIPSNVTPKKLEPLESYSTKIQLASKGNPFVYISHAGRYGYSKEDVVRVYYSDNYIILCKEKCVQLLRGIRSEKFCQEINVDEKDDFLRMLQSFYLQVPGTIILKRKNNFADNEMKNVNNFFNGLKYSEITWRGREEIIIEDKTNYIEIEPYEKLSKVYSMIINMLNELNDLFLSLNDHENVAKALHNLGNHEQNEIDPACRQLSRISNLLVMYPSLMFDVKLKSPVEAMYIGLSSYILERMGDTIFTIAEEIGKFYGLDRIHFLSDSRLIYEHIEKNQKKFPRKDTELSKIFFAPKCSKICEFIERLQQIMPERDGHVSLPIGREIFQFRQEFEKEFSELFNETIYKKVAPETISRIRITGYRLIELLIWVESLVSRHTDFFYFSMRNK